MNHKQQPNLRTDRLYLNCISNTNLGPVQKCRRRFQEPGPEIRRGGKSHSSMQGIEPRPSYKKVS